MNGGGGRGAAHLADRQSPKPLATMNVLARLRTACTIAALAAPGYAIAASFDCAKAASATERAICGSPRLSALDERMARTYERALHALSPEGASRLKASQRSWLRLVTGACGRPAGATATADTHWLEQEFERRAGELDQAGIRLGPYLLNRVDHYDCTRGDPLDAADASGGIATTHLAWPQIDAPRTPATLAWNAARARDEDGSTAAG